MKLKLWYLVFIIGILFVFYPKVEAALNVEGYNGNSTTPPKIKAGECQNSWQNNLFCRFQMVNGNGRGIRVSFVYYDGEKYEQLGRYLDIWSNHPHGTKNIYYSPIKTGGTKSITGPLSLSNFNTGYYDYWIWSALNLNQKENAASNQLKNYFLNQEVMEGYALFLTGHSLTGKDKNGNEDTYFKRPNEVADETGKNPASKGYRFLIEPIRGFATKNNEFYVMTWTEYARLAKSEKRITYTKSWFSEEDVLFVSYKDIGIDRVTSCIKFQEINKRKCDILDILPGGYGRSGHFLQIIDFSDLLPTESCEIQLKNKHDNGEALDKEDYECCDELRDEIDKEYKDVLISNSVNTTEWCMKISGTEDEFYNCLKGHIQGIKNKNTKFLEYSEKLYKFYQDYPECGGGSSCEEAKAQRDKEYDQCKENLKNHSYWMTNELMGLENQCDYIRDLKTEQIKNKYPVGCIDDEDDNTENKKYSCVYDKENDIYYGITGKVLTGSDREEQYKKECLDVEDPNNPDVPDQPIHCDYNDRNVFPSTQCGTNTACCEEKEKEFREQAIKNNWTDNQLYNEIYKWYNEPGMEFRKNCLCGNDPTPDPDEEDCTWEDYEVSGLTGMGNGKCTSSTIYGAHDTENWNCIYKSNKIEKGSSTEIFRDYFIEMSNPYCSVYCREDIGNEGPNGKMIVKAGNHFTVNNDQTSKGIENWAPIHFYSKRICYTAAGSAGSYDGDNTKINYEKFESDWVTANRNAAIAWDAQERARIQVDLTKTYQKAGGCGKCCGKDCPPGQCGNWWIAEDRDYVNYNGTKSNVTIDGWCDYYVTREGNRKKYELQQYLSEIDYGRALATLKQTEYDVLACTDWTKFYDDDYYEYDFPNAEEFIKKMYEVNITGRDKNNLHDQTIINIWQEMVKKMKKITPSNTDVNATRYRKHGSYDEFQKYYEFSPDLKLNYIESFNPEYNYSGRLKKLSPSYTEKNNFASSYNASQKYRIKCDDSDGNRVPCELVDRFDYAKIDKVEATYSKDIQYTLPDSVFDIVIKPDGSATSSNGLTLAPNQIAIKLGYSALHTHFMTPTGRYKIELSWDGYTPSSQNESHGYSHNMDKLIHGTQSYECSYQVHNEIIENKDPKCEGDNCEPIYNNDKYKPCKGDNCTDTTLKGLNLIYRPISLTHPFPGIEGEGRKPGSNWNGTSENELIEKYIINNRGLKSDKLYSEAYPMYQITLTPARIKEIRKYNAYEKKEDRGGYNDWNMDCSKATECKSNFIRNPLENGQDFSKYFREECTMSADRNTKSECCGVGNWNDCMEEDQNRNGGNI